MKVLVNEHTEDYLRRYESSEEGLMNNVAGLTDSIEFVVTDEDVFEHT